MSCIVEMRTYKLKPGKRQAFMDMLRERSAPEHDKIGMKIVGPWPSVEDPDLCFFMRFFPDLASRDGMKDKFYEGSLWKNELEAIAMPMIEKYDVVLVEDSENILAALGN
jgi:hypothetical protein